MKYYGRKALALVLSAILIASTASTAFAQDPVEKDEVVYINLSHDGRWRASMWSTPMT